jgi:hypothetical protein
MSNLYKGPSIDASYQVSVHLAEGFQRRRLKYEKLMDDRRQVMVKTHIAYGKVSQKGFINITDNFLRAYFFLCLIIFYYNLNVNHLNFIIAYMYNVCAILLHLIFSVIILGKLPKSSKKNIKLCVFLLHTQNINEIQERQ